MELGRLNMFRCSQRSPLWLIRIVSFATLPFLCGDADAQFPPGYKGESLQVYASKHGALVCRTPEPLRTYIELFHDDVAKAKYLKSPYVTQCKVVPKDSMYAVLEIGFILRL